VAYLQTAITIRNSVRSQRKIKSDMLVVMHKPNVGQLAQRIK